MSQDQREGLAAVMRRLERLEVMHELDENHEHYERGFVRRGEAPFQSTSGTETAASMPQASSEPTYRPPPSRRGCSSQHNAPFRRTEPLNDSQSGAGASGDASSPETQERRHEYGYTRR